MSGVVLKNYQEIPVNKIIVKENVRCGSDPSLAGLMQSIKQHGLLEAIGVCATNKDGYYVLKYGWRRLAAYKKLNYTVIDAKVDDSKVKLELGELLIINIIENLVRKDVTPYELGRSCQELLKIEYTVSEIAASCSISTHKVKSALSAYKETPVNLRDKVQFFGSGSGLSPNSKKGKISASLAYHVTKIGREHNLSKASVTKLLEASRQDGFTREDVSAIGILIDNGVSLRQATAEVTKYDVLRINHFVIKKELAARMKKDKVTRVELCRKIVYGELPPLTRPAFLIGKKLK